MPIPAQFAHIRQRDARTRLLTPVADVPTRKMTAVYRSCVRDERPDLGRRHLTERPAFPHSYRGPFSVCFIFRIHTFLSGRRAAYLTADTSSLPIGEGFIAVIVLTKSLTLASLPLTTPSTTTSFQTDPLSFESVVSVLSVESSSRHLQNQRFAPRGLLLQRVDFVEGCFVEAYSTVTGPGLPPHWTRLPP